VWANYITWALAGEAEAAKAHLIDRVLFVSHVQQAALAALYQGTGADQYLIPNYVSPEHFQFVERRNSTFVIGRLSRADPNKYPADFPVFYEELGLNDVRYRVQA